MASYSLCFLALFFSSIGTTTALSLPIQQLQNAQHALKSASSYDPGFPVENPTKSYWINSPGANPLSNVGSEGGLTEDADVCIIGSGITGMSAAYHLSRSDLPMKVAVFESRSFCSGATGRNGGNITPYSFRGFSSKQDLLGTDEARRIPALEDYTTKALVDLVHSNDLAGQVQLVSAGHATILLTEEDESERRTDYREAKKAGLDLEAVKWLSAEEMNKTYGTNFPGVLIGGHNIWPLKFVTQLYHLSNRSSTLDLHVHTHTPVTSVSPLHNASPKSGRRWELHTARGNTTCGYVLHATNAYAGHLLPQMRGLDGVVPTRGQLMAVRSSATLDELTRTSWDGGIAYGHPRPVSSPSEESPLEILGGGREVTGPRFEVNVTDDSVVNEDVGRALKGYLADVFPGKFEENPEPEMHWTGIMGYTKVGLPFVGPVLDVNKSKVTFGGQYMSAGYHGHGMPRAFGCAEIVAGMITAEMKGEKWAKPEWLPEVYLTWNR